MYISRPHQGKTNFLVTLNHILQFNTTYKTDEICTIEYFTYSTNYIYKAETHTYISRQNIGRIGLIVMLTIRTQFTFRNYQYFFQTYKHVNRLIESRLSSLIYNYVNVTYKYQEQAFNQFANLAKNTTHIIRLSSFIYNYVKITNKYQKQAFNQFANLAKNTTHICVKRVRSTSHTYQYFLLTYSYISRQTAGHLCFLIYTCAIATITYISRQIFGQLGQIVPTNHKTSHGSRPRWTNTLNTYISKYIIDLPQQLLTSKNMQMNKPTNWPTNTYYQRRCKLARTTVNFPANSRNLPTRQIVETKQTTPTKTKQIRTLTIRNLEHDPSAP
jgi:hypothetical protein